MALLTLNFSSSELMKQTEIIVCAPDPKNCSAPLSEKKVLWLLHGLSDNDTCWLRFSNIERYANEHSLVVVMPNGDRSMYMDGVLGQNYFSFISKELPKYLHNLLGISNAREMNFIAGLSMGGMGAAKIALSNPDKYMGFGSFSGLLDIKFVRAAFMNQIKNEFPFMENVFDKSDFDGADPKTLLDKDKHADMKMFVSCGTEDYWIASSYSFKEKADKHGLDVKYVFEPGGHEWRLWDKWVKEFIEYIV